MKKKKRFSHKHKSINTLVECIIAATSVSVSMPVSQYQTYPDYLQAKHVHYITCLGIVPLTIG